MFFCVGGFMQLNAVKMTLIICLTIIISSILIIAYNEYTQRYILLTTPNSDLYIFDQKSGVLNQCNENGCKIIKTKLPADIFFSVQSPNWMSKMFDEQETISDEAMKNGKKDEAQKVKIKERINMPEAQKEPLG